MTIQLRNSEYRVSDPEPLHYTACGLDDVYLVNGFTRETIEDEDYVKIADLDGLWKAIGLHLVTTRKILGAKDIKFLRDQMDMTQAQLGALLRVSDQTVARWEKGETKIVPGPGDFMLRVLFLGSPAAQPQGGEILQELKKLCEEIIARDDAAPRRIMFRHNEHSRRWKRAAERQIAYA